MKTMVVNVTASSHNDYGNNSVNVSSNMQVDVILDWSNTAPTIELLTENLKQILL